MRLPTVAIIEVEEVCEVGKLESAKWKDIKVSERGSYPHESELGRLREKRAKAVQSNRRTGGWRRQMSQERDYFGHPLVFQYRFVREASQQVPCHINSKF